MDQFSWVIVCQQKTDLKQPTLPCTLGLKTFCFSSDNVFLNSCIPQGFNQKRVAFLIDISDLLLRRLGRHLAADYTIIMSRTLKVTGNHVMYDRGAWFLRVIMSSSRALCCLPSVKKQKHDFQVCFIDEQDNEKIVEDKVSQTALKGRRRW